MNECKVFIFAHSSSGYTSGIIQSHSIYGSTGQRYSLARRISFRIPSNNTYHAMFGDRNARDYLWVDYLCTCRHHLRNAIL